MAVYVRFSRSWLPHLARCERGVRRTNVRLNRLAWPRVVHLPPSTCLSPLPSLPLFLLYLSASRFETIEHTRDPSTVRCPNSICIKDGDVILYGRVAHRFGDALLLPRAVAYDDDSEVSAAAA